MISWIERGSLGRGWKDTLKVYVFDLVVAGGVAILVGSSRGQDAAVICVPLAALTLVISQRVTDLLMPSQLLHLGARDVVVFYLDYVPRRVLDMLASGAVVGVGCDVAFRRRRHREFALLLAPTRGNLLSEGEERALQRMLAGLAEQASAACGGLAAVFVLLSAGVGFVLLAPGLIEVSSPGFHLLTVALVFTLYIALHLLYTTLLILVGRRKVRSGECVMYRYSSPGIGHTV